MATACHSSPACATPESSAAPRGRGPTRGPAHQAAPASAKLTNRTHCRSRTSIASSDRPSDANVGRRAKPAGADQPAGRCAPGTPAAPPRSGGDVHHGDRRPLDPAAVPGERDRVGWAPGDGEGPRRGRRAVPGQARKARDCGETAGDQQHTGVGHRRLSGAQPRAPCLGYGCGVTDRRVLPHLSLLRREGTAETDERRVYVSSPARSGLSRPSQRGHGIEMGPRRTAAGARQSWLVGERLVVGGSGGDALAGRERPP